MPKTEKISVKGLEGVAENLIKTEAQELISAASRIDRDILRAAEIILNHSGKIVICGIGKSGIVGQKIVATLNSTGTRAVYMHAADALHGDLGIYRPGDPTILISKSGSTEEIIQIITVLKEFKSPLIGIVGNLHSPIAHSVDVVIDASVKREADPLGVVPTSSTTLAIAIGDGLAAVLMAARKFRHEDFARIHPGGTLGRRLRLHVKDIMRPVEMVALTAMDESLQSVVVKMTEKPQGASIVIGENLKLKGIITEGDIRRCLAKNIDFLAVKASSAMTPNPVSITGNALLHEAINLMEDRASQISVLPVVGEDRETCIGLIRLHDIYQTKLV